MIHGFKWEYPLFAFLCSGWFIAIYLAMRPGFNKMMSEASEDGILLNVVPPTMWLGMFVAANMIGWMAAAFIPTGVDE